MKNVSIQGVCKPLESLYSIAKVEQPEDRDYSFSRYARHPTTRARLTWLQGEMECWARESRKRREVVKDDICGELVDFYGPIQGSQRLRLHLSPDYLRLLSLGSQHFGTYRYRVGHPHRHHDSEPSSGNCVAFERNQTSRREHGRHRIGAAMRK